MIVQGKLPMGSRVDEQELCAVFGISRTPLREALKALSVEGLVELVPSRGAHITRTTAGELKQEFEVVAGLERQAAELAAVRATVEDLAELTTLQGTIEQHFANDRKTAYFQANQRIHNRIVEMSGNRVLVEIHARLMARIERARYIAVSAPGRWQESVNEHAEILTALKRHDGAAAGEAMMSHVLKTGEYMVLELAHMEEKVSASAG
jgi:DNA-binding GntR family transcriptional regulator